ncbi:hypothetical protein HZ993_12710 [Rhodoferax sp. AJA081-3]|uniref:hypothetical protein n=1 Tax=Rhodoferax sp. AJA081-3 TaxID=2752316 RepID=UPI001ADFB21C|nr:hypothetical protein [Rhodoferax sp. AJA081-3]QTN26207.1 hypothetical protein HZ993_12710 [Rhodoferax sp. AJA081-3]
MQFVRLGDYFCASHITGPKHNLLQVRLSNAVGVQRPVLETLPAIGNCSHAPLNDEVVVQKVVEGVDEANRRLGTSFHVTHIRRVANDTGPEVLLAYMAGKIVERIVEGGQFQEAERQSTGES